MLITIFNDYLVFLGAKIEKTPNTHQTFFDLLGTPITYNLKGTDFSTPITLFSFLPILKKNMEKCVFGVSSMRCEIRKIGQCVIHVEFTFRRMSVLLLLLFNKKDPEIV